MFDKIKKAIGISKANPRSPTLNTLIMVEEFIKENSGKLGKTAIFKRLPKKVMWQTYQVIMKYLENDEKIRINDAGLVEYVWDINKLGD